MSMTTHEHIDSLIKVQLMLPNKMIRILQINHLHLLVLQNHRAVRFKRFSSSEPQVFVNPYRQINSTLILKYDAVPPPTMQVQSTTKNTL